MMGGSKENRHTPGLEHWSIAVKDGKVLEKEWRTEIPIPRGGPHRSVQFPHLIYTSFVSSYGRFKLLYDSNHMKRIYFLANSNKRDDPFWSSDCES